LESFSAKRAALIYNPVARKLSRSQHLLQRIIEALNRQGTEAALVGTTGPGSASLQARRQIEAGCDLILAAGGDGTINEVANGMTYTGVPLAIIPCGTANVLARETRIPINMLAAAQAIPQMVPTRVATGMLRLGGGFEQRSFLCMAGAGLDADIVCHVNLDLKAALGKLAYYIGGFAQALRPLTEFEVTVDGAQYQASFALVSRVRNYGGDLEIARGASLLRNEFQVVLFRGTHSLRYLPYLAAVSLRVAERVNGCTFVYGRHVTCRAFHGENIFTQVDGELAGQLPISAEIVPDALTLLLPASFVAKEKSSIDIRACA
jgi:YegS/Rv2252/BmrU family lipid kinase